MLSLRSLAVCANLIAPLKAVSRAGACVAVVLSLPLQIDAVRAEPACTAPAPVCDARAAVFAVSGFDPYGSAVRIGADLLVTNRHIVADRHQVTVRLADGQTTSADVVPTEFAGDLILLRAGLPPGPVLAPGGNARGDLYTVGQDIASKSVRVFPRGHVLFRPAADKPLARLHHTAYSQPGTSGGALVDTQGVLVGIVASGGEGRYEAIPAQRIQALQAESGAAFAARSDEIGDAYRDCTETLERTGGSKLGDTEADTLAARCGATDNRQMFDMAAQALGRARHLEQSAELFTRSVETDPNAINSRLGLVITLVFSRRYEEAVPHVRWLVDAIPQEPQVHQYAVQIGKLGNAPDLVEKGLALIGKYNPAQLEAAKKFLAAPLPPER